MIGLGILEFGLLLLGGSYIYALLSHKNKIQYIELDHHQFHRLQNTLVSQNILPNRMLIYTDSNTGVIPHTYDESNLNYTVNQSLQNNPTTLEAPANPTTLEAPANPTTLEAPSYQADNSTSTAQDIANSSALLVDFDDNYTLPDSNLYSGTSI